ncbi:MAG: serine/threonine protein kinase [Deltaproteobacteria bacterium]|nr:serine/threonine protein kinase [Deltaproteobacteria bacterium]
MEPHPYRAVERLPGGACEVYLAVRTRDQLPVVIKMLRAETRDNPALFEKFVSEADLLPLLDHPNVVRRVDFGTQDGTPFLVLEHIPGVDLRQVLQLCASIGHRLDTGLVAFLVQELLKALAHVHRARSSTGEPLGIVHRDVNPDNLLLGFDGAVRLTDFGIAVAARLDAIDELATEGKLAYLAPEQVAGEPIDHRTDVYAAGAVLYELTTGQPPFGGSGVDEQDALRQIAAGDLTPPSKRVARYDRKLEKVVLKAMARKPARRFERAEHMAVELSGFRGPVKDGAAALAMQLGALFPDQLAKMIGFYQSLGRAIRMAPEARR